MAKEYLKFSGTSMSFLRFLYWKNTVWKKDAYLYFKSYRGESKSPITNQYNRLLKLGYIKEYTSFNYQNLKKSKLEIKLHEPLQGKSDAYTCVSITGEGYKYLYDNDKLISCTNEIYKQYKSIVQEPFKTNDKGIYYRSLLQNHIKTVMISAGIPSEINQKPSLLDLLKSISNNADLEYYESIEPSDFMKKYYREFAKDKCIGYVKDTILFDKDGEKVEEKCPGIYYTIREFRDFINTIDPNGADTFKGSICKGILMSSRGIYMVYLSEPGNNKLVRYYKAFDEKIVEAIKKYLVEPLSVKKYDPYNINKDITVSALVLCDTTSLVPSMVMGRKHGIKKSNKVNNIDVSNVVLCANKTYATRLFSNIFVIPSTYEGINSLRYLITHSIDEYYYDAFEVVRKNNNFWEIKPDTIPSVGCLKGDIGLLEQGNHVIYMPVFEVNLLHKLSCDGSNENYVVICSDDKVEAIAHSLRKPFVIFDEEGNKAYFDPDTKKRVYAAIETYNILNKLADEIDNKQNIKSETKQLLTELPIYTEKGYRTDRLKHIVQISREAKKRKIKRKRVQIRIDIDSEEELKIIKDAASIMNISLSKFCNEFLVMYAKEIIEEYKNRDKYTALKDRMSNKL